MKILIIHTAFIGDIVLSIPLIQRLKDMYPESEIDYLTLPSNRGIISNNPNLNEILIYDKKGKDRGIKGFLRVLKVLKEKKYDYAVIPHRFIKSILLAKLSKIPKIVGFDVASGSWLLTEKKKYDMSKHEVERLLNLVDYEGEKIPIKIYPSVENKEKIESILKDRIYKNIIVMAPGSQRQEKIWDINKVQIVIDKLAENKDNLIIISGGEVEKELNLIVDEENVLDLRGKISLLEFAALLEKTDILVSNDSSPVHIASGFEKPFIIGIFGKGKRSLGFFPWSEKSNVIEDNDFYENNIMNVPEKQYGYKKDYYKSIQDISADRVYEEVVKKIGGGIKGRNIGILYVCTGKYDIFFDEFYESCEKYFLKNDVKTYFVFTDSEKLKEKYKDNKNIVFIHQENLGWPNNTLLRYDIFYKNKDKFINEEYLYFFNANVIFKKEVGEEFIPTKRENGLVAVEHPGFINEKVKNFTYENNEKSLAYIDKNLNKEYKYVCGG